jgi:hypothetical protein
MQGGILQYRDQKMTMDELLKNGSDPFSFRPEEGAFRSSLVEKLLAAESEEFADLFSESSSDILVTISGSSFNEGVIRCQVCGDFGERSLEWKLPLLTQPEFDDLTEQLSHHAAPQTAPAAQHAAKAVLRNKIAGNMLNSDEAAQRLHLSTQLLKSKIPCSDYSYSEVDDKIEIKEYYWSTDLIQRLCDIKKGGASEEDLKFIADECCHGDLVWAKEVVGVVAQQSPAAPRDNAAPKEIPKQPARSAPHKTAHHRHKGK